MDAIKTIAVSFVVALFMGMAVLTLHTGFPVFGHENNGVYNVVQGKASEIIPADVVEFTVSIETIDDSEAVSKSRNMIKTENIRQFLRSENITEFATSYYSTYRSGYYLDNTTKYEFITTREIAVKTDKVDGLQAILDGIVKSNASEIRYFRWSLKESTRKKKEKELLPGALKDAKEKAMLIHPNSSISTDRVSVGTTSYSDGSHVLLSVVVDQSLYVKSDK